MELTLLNVVGRKRHVLRAGEVPLPNGRLGDYKEQGQPMREQGFFGRTGLVLPAVIAPMAEAALLRAVDPGSA